MKIQLSNNKVFFDDDNKSILDSALAADIMLEHSCRTGKCGVCKTQVLSGSTEILQAETSLTSDLLEKGYILTCCRRASSDLVLDTEDLGDLAKLKTLTLPARIDSMSLLADDVIQVFLRLPPNNGLQILSGQYVDVIGPGGLRRSYSIANDFSKGGKIELHIRQVSNGKMSAYWFDAAKVNDLLRIEGPRGTFCWRDRQESTAIFLATGTGIAPIKSMLEQLDANPQALGHKKIAIYWGGRRPEDFYWEPAFNNIECRFLPCLSRESNDWSGRRGYVQEHALQDHTNLSDCVVYACGSLDMINSANTLLVSHGLKPGNFLSDAFVSS
jgi:CDP-4-dehydro-6-deoxyglucose reductase, E3